MKTLLLSRSECIALLEAKSIVSALRDAFVSDSAVPTARARRVRAQLDGKGTSTVLFPDRN
jgi:hypothetical protein